MNKKITLTMLGFLLLATNQIFAQDTVFFTDFDYEDVPFVIEPNDLNGAADQVGEWSGDEFPEGIGDILFAPDSVGIVPSPYGGSLFVLDRPTGDPDRPNSEENSDFTGSYFADLSKAVDLVGAEVSFAVGTRRTSGNQNKAYDIIGRDSSGEESFHLRVGTSNNGFDRLGVVTDAGATVNYDLPTVVGDDGPDDLDNTGGFNADDGPGFGAEIANVLVRLGAGGFTVDFSYPEEGTSSNANAYTTSLLSYNGSGVDLAQLEFTYEASTANGRNSGYILDTITATGFQDLLQGDFDFNGVIDLADYLILQDNFGTGTTFSQGDFDFDGVVGLFDFVGLKTAFGAAQGGGAAAVPEPSAISMPFIGIAAAAWLRRRGRSHSK